MGLKPTAKRSGKTDVIEFSLSEESIHPRISTDELADELGMISQIVDPPDKLREAAQELGETIAKNSPAAMASATKDAAPPPHWAEIASANGAGDAATTRAGRSN